MIKVEVFTDPMMGLSYESEPFMRYLETHFEGQLTFSYTMAGLVRDVNDFMTPEERVLGDTLGIQAYNQRLASIYKAEEQISGLPINMENFQLFSATRRSSLPLNLAYKAVETIAPHLAEQFLYLVRYKTIVETRPTTKQQELVDIVESLGIDKTAFEQQMESAEVKDKLAQDFQKMQTKGIRALPAYLVEYEGKSILLQGVIRTPEFSNAIAQLTNGQVVPQKVPRNDTHLIKLLEKHPLISPIELQSAYDFQTLDEVETFIEPLIREGKISRKIVTGGYFIAYVPQT